MKQGWEIKKLGEVCTTTQGVQITKSEQYEENLIGMGGEGIQKCSHIKNGRL